MTENCPKGTEQAGKASTCQVTFSRYSLKYLLSTGLPESKRLRLVSAHRGSRPTPHHLESPSFQTQTSRHLWKRRCWEIHLCNNLILRLVQTKHRQSSRHRYHRSIYPHHDRHRNRKHSSKQHLTDSCLRKR